MAIALLEAVCTVFRVSKMDVMSARRYDYIIGARDTFYYLARHMTPRTHEEIGRFLGDRDHTTIIKGVSRISRRLSKHRAKLAEVVTLLGADPEDVLP